MGENGVNIANFTLGRSAKGGEAIAILYVDDPVAESILDKLRATGKFNQVKALAFDMA
jgi:D-3-phosphoglycerate dehydrogenase